MNKNFLFVLVALLATTTALNAQKVALHSAGTIQHFEGTDGLKAAYEASTDGDTIYLPGGAFNMPDGFEKQLTIFGAGHYPDSTQATRKTTLNSTLYLNVNADNFYMEGVDINGNISFEYDKSINNVTIKRCKFTNLQIDKNSDNTSDTTYCNNISVIGNVINYNLSLRNARNVLVANNIIRAAIKNSYTNQIVNNVFIESDHNTSYTVISNSDNNYIANNIFLQDNYSSLASGNGNAFRNNIFARSSPYYGVAPELSGNYVGVSRDTILVNQTGRFFDYSHDYHLQSPDDYVGTDGTQVGIYGGMFPYKEGAVPSNPHIQIAVIEATASNGQLNVEIKAASQED